MTRPYRPTIASSAFAGRPTMQVVSRGGTSNGEPIVVRAAKKPISTLAARGSSVNVETKDPQPAAYERSDVCAVSAASVIVENLVAFEIAAAVVEKYVGTGLAAIQVAHDALHELNRQRLAHWGESNIGPVPGP
jgi:chorismate synthase